MEAAHKRLNFISNYVTVALSISMLLLTIGKYPIVQLTLLKIIIRIKIIKMNVDSSMKIRI